MQVERQETSQPTPKTQVLTPREREIALAIADGASNRDIAARLGITEQTVKNHLTSIFDKVKVDSRLQLAVTMMRSARVGTRRGPRPSEATGIG